MNKMQKWFKKHLRKERFSFLGFIFSIFVFSYNIATSNLVPSQYFMLDAEATQQISPEVFYLQFILFSMVILSIAATFLYYSLKKGAKRKN